MSSMVSSDDERASQPGLGGGSSRSGFMERHQSEAVGFRAALRNSWRRNVLAVFVLHQARCVHVSLLASILH